MSSSVTWSEEERNRARLAELLAQDWGLLLDGQLVRGEGGATFDVIGPDVEAVITSVPDASPDQVERAVEAASRAFPEWRDRDATERARLVSRLGDLIEEHAHDLALLDAADGGAQISVMTGDVRAGAAYCRYFAGLAPEIKGFSIPKPRGVHFSVRQPFGVVAKIIPFNHPILFAVRMIAGPLVAGNTVILKPADATPLSALHLGRLIKDHFPPGVVQILVGDGPTVPRALVRHPAIRRIGFTGSVPTGQGVLQDAAAVNIKRISLELGGKNALIAYPDADPAEVAAGAVKGMNFTWSGQSCGSTSRLVVHEAIADDVIEGIVGYLAEHRIGSPLDPAMHQGPLVSEAQYRKVLDMIDKAVRDGAKIVTGGSRPAHLSVGYYISPTVLDHVDPEWDVAQNEIFGPVLSVIRWGDQHDPVAIANSVEYGLAASVYTNDVRRAHRVAQSLEAGYVWINTTSSHFTGMPFGGFKNSGLGREECLDELLSYTQEKSIHVALD